MTRRGPRTFGEDIAAVTAELRADVRDLRRTAIRLGAAIIVAEVGAIVAILLHAA